jgi:hypothetical protein
MEPQFEKLFGIMIPGELPFFDFELINDMLVVTITNPSPFCQFSSNFLGNITILAFFLNAPLPDGLGGTTH